MLKSLCLVFITLFCLAANSQTIRINQALFVGGTYRDSSNITVPIDIDVNGSNGFGYDTAAAYRRFNNNIFCLVLVPANNANAVFTDTTTSINMAGAKIIGRYRFINDQVPYTTFVNGVIPPLGVGMILSNYVLKVIATRPFTCSDASPVITIKRTINIKVKSFAVAGTVGNTSAIYYDSTHSSMFFGYCGTLVDKNGNALDTTVSLLDSTSGNFNTAASYDSVILVNNSFTTLKNTNSVVYSAKYTAKGAINFPSRIIKAGEYYTVILKAMDDSGYVSSKSYFLLNTLWNLNVQKRNTTSNGCTGDTVYLYPLINNVQLAQQFGLMNNFPGLLYTVNWGDPKSTTLINYTYNELISNGGVFSHQYDTSSCIRAAGNQYWSITAKLANPFSGTNCSLPIATSTIQTFSPSKAKIAHHANICMYSILDTAKVILKDSSYGGSNINCTSTAYYTWYRTYVGCGNINDTNNNPFGAVDSSCILQNGIYRPIAVNNYNYKDTFSRPGKYIFKLVADNKTCLSSSYVDSMIVVAPPKVNFRIDSSGILKDSITGCAPLTIKLNNQSDSSCFQKWSFLWEVVDASTNTVVPPGTIYGIPTPYKNTDSAPIIVFYRQGTYKIRLIGKNACSKGDTTYKTVAVISNGGVNFLFGNKITANGIHTSAYCLYTSPSKNVNFDSAIRTPAADTVLKPMYGGIPASIDPYNWKITDKAGSHHYNLSTDSTKRYPNVTFTTPTNKDGDFMIFVTYASTCGVSSDSFELILNRQVTPKIIEPTKDTSICPNSGCIQFTGTATAADGTNSGYYGLQWIDQTNNSLFGNALVANLCNINTSKTLTFRAIKAQPNACGDTTVTRKISVLPTATGRDTTFNICSGTRLNYNLAATSSINNIYQWNSICTVSSVIGYTNCTSSCNNIIDLLTGDGTPGQVIYVVTPISANGCSGIPFQVIVNILPYPTIAHSVIQDTLCSGSVSNINIGTNTMGATYNWTVASAGSGLTPYGIWPTQTNQIPTSSNGYITGLPLNISYINNGQAIEPFTVKFYVAVAGGTCPSPVDSITMYVLPSSTQPRANLVSDSIYLCNQNAVTLNATVPNANKGEVGKWTTINGGLIFPADSTKYNATVYVIPGNEYKFKWSISSPLLMAYGCPTLSDVVTIFDRPTITKANAGKDTIICNYAGLFEIIPLNGNRDTSRPWETGTWTTLNNPAINDSFVSTNTHISHKYNDRYIFRGIPGEYDLIWTISNDAGCPSSFDTLMIQAGFGNNSIVSKDTTICNGSCIDTIKGSLPMGGGGNYVYQWYTYPATVIPGATRMYYSRICPSVTTQIYRTTSSTACPNVNLKTSLYTIKVKPSPIVKPINGSNSVCIGNTTFLQDSTVGGLWSNINKYTGTINGGLYTPIHAGKDTIVYSVKGSNSCSNSVVTTMTVNSLPIKPIASTTTAQVNLNDTIKLFSSSIPSGTYSWLGPNGYSSTIQNPIIASANTLSGGNYIVNATNINTGCTSDTAMVSISVNNLFTIKGKIITPTGKPVNKAAIDNNGFFVYSDVSGNFGYPFSSNSNLILKPFKNNDINKGNGITTFDVALLQAHVLSKVILNSPYKLIAADVNGDGKVTTLDVVYLKRMILGLDSSFTKTSTGEHRLWAFVDSSYVIPIPTNPFPYKDSISYTGLSASKVNQTFIGCKLGDLNFDWNPAIAKPSLNIADAVELSYTSDASIYPSEALGATDGVRIPIKVKNFKDLMGMQYTLNFDAKAWKWIGIDKNMLHIETGTNKADEGKISFLWNDPNNEGITLEDGSVVFELVFKRKGKEAIGIQINIDGSVTSVEALDKHFGEHGVVMKRAENNQPLPTESWTVAPNPTTNGEIHVQMNLSNNKLIVLRLLDQSGNLLYTKQVEGIKGANQFLLKEVKLSSGIYYLQALGVDGETVKKVMVR